MDDGLRPFEGDGVIVVGLYEGIDGLPQLPRRSETCTTQRRAAEDTEPALHLVQPGTVGRREMQVHLRMARSHRSRFGLCVFRLSRMTWISRSGLSATIWFMKST